MIEHSAMMNDGERAGWDMDTMEHIKVVCTFDFPMLFGYLATQRDAARLQPYLFGLQLAYAQLREMGYTWAFQEPIPLQPENPEDAWRGRLATEIAQGIAAFGAERLGDYADLYQYLQPSPSGQSLVGCENP